MLNRQADIRGTLLETRYRERAGSYLGVVLRKVKTFLPFELEDELEPHLSESDYLDLLQTDLLVRGRPRHRPEVDEVWLVVEVSAVIDRQDVERAVQRAGYMHQAGYVAIPAVAGVDATQGAKSLSAQEDVLMILDGGVALWEKALARALA